MPANVRPQPAHTLRSGRRCQRTGPVAVALVQQLESRVLMSAGTPGDVSAAAAAPNVLRVDAGGGSYTTDAMRRAFAADTGFTGGRAEAAAFAVENTEDDALFSTHRAGAEFTFAQPVPDGNYALWLEFAEPVAGAAVGQRAFDVSAEGRQVLDDYDIVRDAGAARRAVAKSFDVRVTGGQLDLAFRGVVGEAVVSAVVLLPTDPPPEAAPYSWAGLSESERAVLSSTHLRLIGMSLIIHTYGTRGRFPDDLRPIYPGQADDMRHDQFASPRTSTALPRGELSNVEQVGWIDARRDYIYVGAGKNVAMSPDVVLAYENPDRVTGRIGVLFVDAHVEMLERSEAARRLGFPPPPAEPADPPAHLPTAARDPEVVRSAANLRQMAQVMYEHPSWTEGYRRLPATLEVVYRFGLSSTRPEFGVGTFVNPRTSTVAPPADWTAEQKAAWVDASTDYVYLANGRPAQNTTHKDVLVYENPDTVPGGINLLLGPEQRVEFRETRWALETLAVPRGGAVADRHVFYNDSYFDGNNPAAGAADDAAIATDKRAQFRGWQGGFANYTSYSKGINGVMVDVRDLPTGRSPTAADFQFLVGNSADARSWAAAPAPASVRVRRGAGVYGSDRVTLTWADGAIRGQWLRVTVVPTANTGLIASDVFHFGNAPGESGDDPTHTYVDGTDFAGARDNGRNFLNRAPIDFRWDYDRDSFVDGTDLAIARDSNTNFLTALKQVSFYG